MIRSLLTYRVRAFVAVAVVSASLASCSYFLGPDDELDAEVTFSTSPDEGQDLPDSATVAVDGSNIEIVGVITTAGVCREINGAGDITTNEIEITIRADEVGDACPPGLGRFDYQVVVSRVKKGPWIVKVRHLLRGNGVSTLVTAKPVVVP